MKGGIQNPVLKHLRLWSLLLLLFQAAPLFSQAPNDLCSNASTLCPSSAISANNIDATVDSCNACADDPSGWNNCYTPYRTVWFSFVTNSNGGNANVEVVVGNCLSGGAMGDALQGVILEASTACDGSGYSAVSNCVQAGTGTFGMNASGLAPNTRYWVQIGGAMNGSATSPAECNFSISVSGAAVEFTADTNIIHKDCQGSDGEIHLSNVSGGYDPYSFSLNGGGFQSSGDFTGLDAGTYTVTIKDSLGCEQAFGPITIEEKNAPSIDTALVDSASCSTADGSIELDGMSGGSTPYQFELNGTTSQSDSLFSGLEAGMHDVILTDASGCTDTLNDIAVPNSSGIHFAQEVTTISDCGMDNGEAAVDSIAGGTPPFSYQWNDPSSQTDCVATGLPPGSYEVTITDANGCSFTVHNVAIAEEAPDTANLSLLVDKNPSCQGEEVNFTADLVNGGGNPSFEWFVNGTSVQTGSNGSFSSSSLSDGDEIQVAVYPNDSCIYPDTLYSQTIVQSVEAPVNTTLNMNVDPTTVCEGEPVRIMLSASGAGSAPLFKCSKNGSVFYTGTDDTLTHSAFSDGDQLSCTVFPSHPCGDTITSGPTTLDVTPFDPSVDPQMSTIFKGEEVDIQASGGDSYSWTPGSSLSSTNSPTTTASPSQNTTYDVNIQKGSCDTILQATVKVKDPITAPNTITPNGDGKNDTWRIHGIDRFPKAEVTIYDRWGQKVFNSVNYGPSERWAGKAGGQKVPAGTYYYVIELNRDEESLNGDAKDKFTGSITIIY